MTCPSNDCIFYHLVSKKPGPRPIYAVLGRRGAPTDSDTQVLVAVPKSDPRCENGTP